MIRRLKRKFIALALTSLFVLLAVIVLGMTILNYRSVVKEAEDAREEVALRRMRERHAYDHILRRWLVEHGHGDIIHFHLSHLNTELHVSLP